jgi:hypothetical protein
MLHEVVGCQYGIAIDLSWLAIDDRIGQQGHKQHIHRVNRVVFEFCQVVNIDCIHDLASKEAGIRLLGQESGGSGLPASFFITSCGFPPLYCVGYQDTTPAG